MVKVYKKQSTNQKYPENLRLIIRKLAQGQNFNRSDFDSESLNNLGHLSRECYRISRINIVNTPKARQIEHEKLGALLEMNFAQMNKAKLGDILRKQKEILNVHAYFHDMILYG